MSLLPSSLIGYQAFVILSFVKILIVVSHPFELWFNKYVLDELLDSFTINEIGIIWARSHHEDHVDYNRILKSFYPENLKIFEIDCLDFNKSMRHLLRTLKKANRLRKNLRSIKSRKSPILILHDKTRIASRVIMSEFSKIILIQQESRDDNYSYRIMMQETLRDFIVSFLLKIQNARYYALRETENIASVRIKNKGFRVLYWDQSGDRPDIIKIRNSNIFRTANRGTNVLFLGFRFSQWSWFTDRHLVAVTEFLRDFLKHCDFNRILYLPHPRESSEEYVYFSKEFPMIFEKLDKLTPAEILLETRTDIGLVVGFGSTALKSAQILGIPHVSIYQEIDMPKEVERVFNDIVQSSKPFSSSDLGMENLLYLVKKLEQEDY